MGDKTYPHVFPASLSSLSCLPRQTLEGMVSGQRTPGRDGFPRVHVTVDTQMCNTGDQGLQGSFANRLSGRRSQLQALEEIKGKEAATHTHTHTPLFTSRHLCACVLAIAEVTDLNSALKGHLFHCNSFDPSLELG